MNLLSTMVRQATMAVSFSATKFRQKHVFSRRHGLSKWLAILGYAAFCAGMFNAAAQAQSTVTLAWNPPTTTGKAIAGYRVYYGSKSQTYTSVLSVGNVIQATVPNLNSALTYYMAITAVDTSGVESLFSNE